MKLDKYLPVLLGVAALALAGCKNEDPDKHHFDNKLYISSAVRTDDLLIDPAVQTTSRTVSMRMAIPSDQDVTVELEARPDLAAQYNMIYGDNAFALPDEYWEIPEKTVQIVAGTIAGNDVAVNFKDINQLDVTMRYVLPVTISRVQGAELLENRRTVYFVVRGAALINVVADITKLKAAINWSETAAPLVTGMEQITVEALVRSSDWEAGRGNALSTLFGIEGSFLIRIGDADRPRDQLQMVAPSGGNWPAANAAPGLPVNEWIHVAIVYDTQNNERIYYQNGEQVAYSNASISGTVDLRSNCWIGFAWDNTRWLPGQISELRIWNVARTAQQIADNPYRVDPSTEGLVAYWKFNEGMGRTIKDQTGNGTDITFERCTGETESDDPAWVDVQIPSLE